MSKKNDEIDPEEVRKLASYHCKNEELADFFGCSVDTITRRFADILTKERANRKIQLRNWQWEAARKGNVTMQIWLGKNHLGQTDTSDTKTLIIEDRTKLMEEQARQIIELVKMP